jgi:hypothetical protein
MYSSIYDMYNIQYKQSLYDKFTQVSEHQDLYSAQPDHNRPRRGRSRTVVESTSNQITTKIHAKRMICHELLHHGLLSGARRVGWDLVFR